tara:strand:- start:3757 stop:4500 length:744 start_codon:yes stop_codon:yes gene_type:complete
MAINSKTDEYVAVKIIDKNITPSSINFEIYSNTKLCHKNIIKCIGWFENKTDVYVLYEYAPVGDLFDYLIKSDSLLKETEVKNIIEPIIQAVIYIHSKNWIHRDIKPENILLFRGIKPKLGDLEMSIDMNKHMPNLRSGTPSYMAPEVLDYHEETILESGYGTEVDCWSIGVLTYECLLKTPPFQGKSIDEILESIKKYDINFWNISENARDFIMRCLELDPLKRIKSHEMLLHEWFNEKKFNCCLF